jgi:peptidoglycan/xylan/chitin deacetylase (PgdA/CDA1 family)
MYHYIRVNPDPSDKLGEDLSVRPEVFEEELRWLASHGYHALTLRSVVSSWKGNKPLPDKPVVLTFDDGYEDVYTVALPAMQRYGFVGVAFAVSSFVGRPGYASAEQLRKLQEQGWEIGAHSADHVDLTKLGSEALRRQVEGSREALTILLGERPRSFSYPSGRWNQTVERAVAGAGFEAAVTTQWGVARPTMDTLSLPRLRIRGTTTLRSFNQIMLAVEP